VALLGAHTALNLYASLGTYRGQTDWVVVSEAEKGPATTSLLINLLDLPGAQVLMAGRMASNQTIESEQLIAQIKSFFHAQSLRIEEPRICSYCGASMQFLDATFWIEGSGSGWNLRLPVCSCHHGPEV